MLGYIVFLLAASFVGYWVGSTIYEQWTQPQDGAAEARRTRMTNQTYAPPKRVQASRPAPPLLHDPDPTQPVDENSPPRVGPGPASDWREQPVPWHRLHGMDSEADRPPPASRPITDARTELPPTLESGLGWFDDEPETDEVLIVTEEETADHPPVDEELTAREARTVHLDLSGGVTRFEPPEVAGARPAISMPRPSIDLAPAGASGRAAEPPTPAPAEERSTEIIGTLPPADDDSGRTEPEWAWQDLDDPPEELAPGPVSVVQDDLSDPDPAGLFDDPSLAPTDDLDEDLADLWAPRRPADEAPTTPFELELSADTDAWIRARFPEALREAPARAPKVPVVESTSPEVEIDDLFNLDEEEQTEAMGDGEGGPVSEVPRPSTELPHPGLQQSLPALGSTLAPPDETGEHEAIDGDAAAGPTPEEQEAAETPEEAAWDTRFLPADEPRPQGSPRPVRPVGMPAGRQSPVGLGVGGGDTLVPEAEPTRPLPVHVSPEAPTAELTPADPDLDDEAAADAPSLPAGPAPGAGPDPEEHHDDLLDEAAFSIPEPPREPRRSLNLLRPELPVAELAAAPKGAAERLEILVLQERVNDLERMLSEREVETETAGSERERALDARELELLDKEDQLLGRERDLGEWERALGEAQVRADAATASAHPVASAGSGEAPAAAEDAAATSHRLRDQLSGTERKLAAAEQALAEHLSEARARDRRLEELAFRVQELESDLASARSAVSSRSDLAQARDRVAEERARERDALAQRVRELEAELARLGDEDSRELLAARQRFEEALARQEAALEAQARTLQSREHQLAAVEAARDELEQDLTTLRVHLEESRKARLASADGPEAAEIARLQAALERQQEIAAAHLASQQERHAAELDAVREEHALAEARHSAAHTRAVAELGAQVARLERELADARSTHARELQEALSAQASATTEEQAAQEEELRALLHIRDEEVSELTRERGELRRRYDELTERSGRLGAERTRLRAELEQARDRVRQQAERLATVQASEGAQAAELENLQRRLAESSKRLELGEQQLMERDAELRERDAAIHERQLEIRALENRLRDRNEALRSRDQALKERDREIDTLLAELEARTSELHRRDASIGDQASALASLEERRRQAEDARDRLRDEVDQLRASLSERDRVLSRQEEELLRLRDEARSLRELEAVAQAERAQVEAQQRRVEQRKRPGGSLLPPVMKSRYGKGRVRSLTGSSRLESLAGEDEDEID